MPLWVVRLTAPLEVVRGRLGEEGTSGRGADAERTVAWAGGVAGPEHVPADLIVDNTRPVAVVATDILDRLGWLRSEPGRD